MLKLWKDLHYLEGFREILDNFFEEIPGKKHG